jgi:C-terminal processing protease CtpA/Prc
MRKTKLMSVCLLSMLLLGMGAAFADDDWCDRVIGGPPGSVLPVDLSAAHAAIRFFGVQTKYSIADQALAAAVDSPGALSSGALGALQAYSASLAGVCVVPATATSLGPAQVSTSGKIALIRPGTGSVQISPTVDTVIVDLRDLPAVPGLRAALDAAVAPALSNVVHRSDRIVRQHFGMKDEAFSPTNVYQTGLIQQAQANIPASWSNGTAPTLAVVTARRLASEAAELAGTLRIAGKAFIVGDDVLASVAESRWRGIGTLQDTGSGLAYRVEDLLTGGGHRWPDVIPADIRSSDPTGDLEGLRKILKDRNVQNLNGGDALRPALQQVDPFDDQQPGGLRLGDIRGQLIVFHGAARLFFPYFPAVGDNIDPRLQETLTTLGSSSPVDPVLAFRVARRFSEALHDGHYFWFTYYNPANPFFGGLPVNLEQSGGEAIVRKSNAVELQTGDTITSIGGLSTADWFAQESLRTSAATDGFRFIRDYQEGELWRMLTPLAFGIRAPNGSTRTATISPYTYSNFGGLLARPYSFRSEGPLTDLGAPDLYFLNLSSAVLGSDVNRYNAAVDQARSLGSAGMIIDMRGSKSIANQGLLNQRLICTKFSSMTFNVPVWSGPDVRTVNSSHYEVNPSKPYCGPMVLLVSAQTLSNGEDFSAQLVGAHRVTVVGRRSAGTNGNITSLLLPGGGFASFTGMEVRNVDGSQFHGIGIVPDYVVNYTAQDFVDGRDRDLEKAIQVLHGTP